MALVLKNIHFGYLKQTEILHGVSASLPDGKLTAVIGPNGCGKTTLVKSVNRIHAPSCGEIFWGDTDLRSCRRSQVAKLIGYVPQVSSGSLNGTVVDYLLLGRRQFLSWHLSPEDLSEVETVMRELDILELANSDFQSLSGGQRQKVMVARALLQKPELLLFDEPTSNLDLKNQLQIMDLGKKLVTEKGKTVVMVVHDLNMALHYADYIVLMSAGQIIACGSPAEVLTPEQIEAVYGLAVKVESCGFVNPF